MGPLSVLHRCCKLRWIRASDGRNVVEVEVKERIERYAVEGSTDPLPAAIRGRGDLSLELVCTTACLASALGQTGEALRKTVGSTAVIRYERKGGNEVLRVDGVDATLESENARLRLSGLNVKLEQLLEKCLLQGASIVAPKLEEVIHRGIEIGDYRVYEFGVHLAAIAANPLVKDAISMLEARGECVEEILSRIIFQRLAPLAAASIAVYDYISRSIVVYPVHGKAFIDIDEEVGDYGKGLGRILATSPREASVIASRLLGMSIDVRTLSIDGVAMPVIRVESTPVIDAWRAPLPALSLSIAAALLAKRSILVAVDAPIERLDRSTLLHELERVNAVLLYSRL